MRPGTPELANDSIWGLWLALNAVPLLTYIHFASTHNDARRFAKIETAMKGMEEKIQAHKEVRAIAGHVVTLLIKCWTLAFSRLHLNHLTFVASSSKQSLKALKPKPGIETTFKKVVAQAQRR